MDQLPRPTPADLEALWRTRAPRLVRPEELAAWLAALCPGCGEELRSRPVLRGKPFTL